ncbi:zinc finger protein 835-like [Frankliniella occidentalis]|uniref:Zinc finger protein 835-like n=1 Tax=Frankliniella occidentalis TaxID=133901 RepID=A0A6J1TKI0_FRAOC|nr:zinc finger protein 835-like [Frankliniella occidentalis]
MDSEEYRLWFDDSNPSDPEPSPPQQEPVRDCYVRLENIRLPGSTSRRAPRAERSLSPEGGRRDVGAGRSRGRSRSVAPSRPTSRTASRPRHKSKDARSSSCSRAPGALGMGTPRIVLGRSKSATGSRLLKCALCLKSFHLQASLSKHVRAHQRCTPDRCLICGKRVESLVQAMEHFMSHPADVHDDDDKVRCAVCAREFPRQRLYRLATHVLAHTGEAPFPCATCHRRFRTSYSLVTHAERVHGSRDAGVRRSAALVRAILPVYRCSVCPARLGTPKLLIEHKQQVHGAAAGGATCLYCPAALDSSEAMERHMAAQHASERPHACARCMKRFSTRHSLARHMLSHSHAYRCSLCPERFATARECLDHVNGVHLRPAH